MTTILRTFSFLTAAFPHGAYQSQGFNQPDLRAPSIKGQLRWWYDALFEQKAAEDQLFGGLKNSRPGENQGPEGSRVIVRVRPVAVPPIKPADFMPHKGHDGGMKQAICPGARYELVLQPRREGVTGHQEQCLQRVADSWLLLGAIGQRANRGAGSVWPEGAPSAADAYMARVQRLLQGTRLRCALLDAGFSGERELRYTAGDFIDGPVVQDGRGSFDEVTVPWWPFGAAEARKPSPLKLRAVMLDGQLRLVALWDGRHHAADNLRQGVEQLAKEKEIGRLLESVLAKLCV